LIVGVVENTKPGESEITLPGVFVPIEDPATPETGTDNVSMAVRTIEGAALDLAGLQTALAQGLGNGSVLATLVEKQILPRKGQFRFLAALLAALAVGVLVVSATGVVAATASAVSSRHREFAIRIALGAGSGHLVSLLLRTEVRAALAGAAVGLTGCFGLARLLGGWLMGGQTSAMLTSVAVIALLGTAALAAMWWPVRRAHRRMGTRQGLVEALR
jgi:ABC-type antimicrobial peptide transport system permease subunit